MSSLARLPAVIALLGAGCLGPLEPDVGDPQRERCVDEDSDPSTDVSFRRDIFAGVLHPPPPGPGCRCHMPSSPTPIGLELGGLDLSSYDGLRRGGASSGASIVIPGQPCESVLVLKLSDGPPFGSRMPLNGPPYLTDEQLELIRDWIAEGARDD
jgi:hypothetical protein